MRPEMKMFVSSIIGTAALLVVFFVSQALFWQKETPKGASVDGSIQYYRSTMNPKEVSKVPAKDSMGMEMVPVYNGKRLENTAIFIDPRTQQNMGVRLAEVKKAPLKKLLRTVAVVTYDETT